MMPFGFNCYAGVSAAMQNHHSLSKRSLGARRLSSCLLAALFALALALPAVALPIAFSGTFDDPTVPEADGDVFTLTNEASPTSQDSITQIVIDLSTATTLPVTFDETGSAFTVTLEGGTGYTGYSINGANTVLTIGFTDFDPGESFNFTIDVDDNNNQVDAARIAASTVTATYMVGGGTTLDAFMVAGAGRTASWTASTDVVVPEPESLPLIGLGLIGLAWRRRRACRC
jgi:multisubunit Na+/H+ antiporter MnhC subunit